MTKVHSIPKGAERVDKVVYIRVIKIGCVTRGEDSQSDAYFFVKCSACVRGTVKLSGQNLLFGPQLC